MTANQLITAKAAWYSSVREIRFANDAVTSVVRKNGASRKIEVRDIERLRIEGGPLRNGLKITLKSGHTVDFGGLQKKESQQIKQAVEERILALRAQEERRLDREAARRAREIKPEIMTLHSNLQDLLSSKRYTRHSETDHIPSTIAAFTKNMNQRLRGKLDKEAAAAFTAIDALQYPEALEKARQEGNQQFTKEETARIRKGTEDITSHPMTDEQTTAVATDEDATLVLAGAGTGKTSVITGKIAHLVRNQDVPPPSILALAFNVDAAREIRQRLPEDFNQSQVSTFHSFAYHVVGQATGEAPTVSKLATDDIAYQKAIDDMLTGMMTSKEFANDVISLVTSEYAEYRTPFEFSNEKEYREYVRTTEPRSFNSEQVKSQEELALANFLATNGIAYEYEKPYKFPTATSQHRQYQPDFYLPDYDIYIEHFAVDEYGRPPYGWAGYAEGMEWKRKLHQERGTRLVETYSWERSKGVLLRNLEQKLKALGVEFKPEPVEELVKKLSQFRVRRLAGLLGTFLNHAKSGNMTAGDIAAAAESQRDGSRTDRFLRVFTEVRRRYEELLAAEQAKDFHDLINEAAEHINARRWENPFQYVLIDEFQDISNGRMNLAKALKKPGLAYFLVGDDWQSIYRFAGSYVGLLHQCDQHLGHTQRVNLTRTFRFGDGIATPSTGFIQQNPEQTKREMMTGEGADDHGITVIAHGNAAEGVRQALKEIDAVKESRDETIKVLGRYNRSVGAVREKTATGRANTEYSTIHRTKGLEADHVVVIDLKDDRAYGFPSQIQDDPLLNIVMPPIHGDPYPFAEERRLFYVALTRARKGAYLITDPNQPSEFVRELAQDYPGIGQLGAIMPKCPGCSTGSLRQSQSENNLRCTNYPICRHMWPRCPGCNIGYTGIEKEGALPVCTNPECEAPVDACPGCRRGVLTLKRSRRGEFWGCSQYWDSPSCRYSRDAVGQRG